VPVIDFVYSYFAANKNTITMKKSILLLPLLAAGLFKSQEGRVGINTASPKSTFDVNGKSGTDGLSLSGDITGLQAPRLTRAELTDKGNTLYNADQRGAIVYITDVSGGNNASQRVNITSVGYYYFDGTLWNRIASSTGSTQNPITSDNGLTKTGDNIQLGGILIKDTDVATAGFNTTFSGTGNVGIGTKSPTQKLEVVGNGKFIASNNLVEAVVNAPSSGLNLIKNGTANLSNSTVMGFVNFGGRINNTDNQSVSTIVGEYKGNGTNNLSNLQFRTSGVVDNDMVLSESGDLGVGISISPTQKLDVDGNVRFRQVPENAIIDTNDRLMVLNNSGVAKKVPLSSVQSTVTSDNGLTKTGNNIQLGGALIKNTDIATAGFNTTFSGAGKVGIGTKIPSNLLTINKDGITSGITTSFVDGITLTSNMNSNVLSGPGLYFEGADGPAGQKVLKMNYSKNISDQSFLNFQAVSDDASSISTNVLSVFHNGKIGVGTTSPSENLDINSNVRVRGINTNAGTSTDRIVVADGNGVLKSIPGSTYNTQAVTANNGLTLSGGNIQLGGSLIQNTDISTAGFNTTFSGAGNLGLGIVPTKKLDVDGDTYLRSRLNLAAAYDDGATLIVKNKIAGNWIASFAGSGTDPYRAVLLDNGNFGLGTTSPSEKLDVSGGNVRVRDINSLSGENLTVKKVVADSNGLLRTLPSQEPELVGNYGIDNIAGATATATESVPASDVTLGTYTFTVTARSLVNIIYNCGYSFPNILNESNGKTKRVKTFCDFTSVPASSNISVGTVFAHSAIPVTFSGSTTGSNLVGTYISTSSASLVLSPGVYTVRLVGNAAIAGNQANTQGLGTFTVNFGGTNFGNLDSFIVRATAL
jgi:hypothetical protein